MNNKILFVIGALNVGGSERHLLEVIPRLRQHGWEPIVYCLTAKGALAAELEQQDVPVLLSPIGSPSAQSSRPRRLLDILRKIVSVASFIRQVRPKIVHFFLPYPYIIGAPAALLAGTPVRVMSRRSLNAYQKGRPAAAFFERMLHKTMTAVVGNSRRVVQQLRSEEGVPAERLGLIYNGISLKALSNGGRRGAIREALGISLAGVTFVIVANLIPYKGHADLLVAFSLAHPKLPPGWRLLIVGRDDGIAEHLQRQADSLGLGDHVLFLGPRRDIYDLLQASDVGLLSSHEEGFSNVLLEYMAAGLPVVGTDVGGNPESIVHGDNGLIVPPHDPPRLAEAIVRVGTDEIGRAAMGKRGRCRVEERYGIDTCVARYDDLYRGLIAGLKPNDIGTVRVGQ